ncbi:protein of unknown function [Candidatus Nitrosocosmicus franklandus]|uniref:Uncharacterized protein n=1 Tax=Candidatus Nitrosocosmicus franklandianus TaxID=1798806 RepID=A0A484IBE1_9ARCH|nr:protein of unknown function [Candidatus Nitrosocosmicus franklandus]
MIIYPIKIDIQVSIGDIIGISNNYSNIEAKFIYLFWDIIY